MRTILIIILVFISTILNAQNIPIDCEFDNVKNYETLINLGDEFSFEILKDERYIEFLFENEQLVKYETVKRIIKINNDKAIDIFNKFSISLFDVIDIIDIKARTIRKDGKVLELDKSNIKEVENLDEEGNYKKFAIDGIEIGSIVEINFKIKKAPRLYGSYFFQNEGTIYNALLQIISPKHLDFDAISYNKDFFINDTIIQNKKYLTLTCDSIESIDVNEAYSFPDANKVRIEFSYRMNNEYHTTPYYTYSLATKNIYNTLYNIDNKEEKLIKKLIQKIELDNLSNEEKIFKIEKYVKENFLIRPIDNINDGKYIVNIINNGYSSEIGITRLFTNVLKFTGIKHNVVATCDRSYKKFDENFMSWNYLNDYFIYFPETNKLLAPTLIEYRYPAIPTDFYFNNGLFLKLIEIGGIENAVHKIKQIPDHHYTESFINHYITVDFSEDLDMINTSITHSFGGNSAYSIKQYFAFLPEEQRNLMIKDYIKEINDDIEIVDYNVENGDININPFEKPFNIITDLKIHSIIENAGNSYLFNIGELIGRQVELYQEHKRQQQIDFNYPHILDREIIVNIPEGYEIVGLEKLKMDIKKGNLENDNNYTMGFLSDYEFSENILTVKIHEYYTTPTYPIEQYEDFRKVVNAAADFTKIVLVLKSE